MIRWRRWPGRAQPPRDVMEQVDRELGFHIDMRTRELVSCGWTEPAARDAALREFGDVAAARVQLARIDAAGRRRRQHSERWRGMGQDVGYAVRLVRRQPLPAAVLMFTLALGVGATGAILTLADAALVRSLPHPAPDGLVHVWQTQRTQVGSGLSAVSWPDFVEWRGRGRSFAGLEGYDPTNVTVPLEGGAAMLRGARVTAGFLQLLGVRSAAGRTFVAGEDGPGGAPVVVLGHAFWRQRFGGNADIVGRFLEVDGVAHEVVGVLPAGFQFAPLGDTDLWFPVNTGAEARADRGNRWLSVVGRLRDGVRADLAGAELSAIAEQLAAAHPSTNAGRGALVRPLRDEVVGPVRATVAMLLGASLVVLCIAAANVAGLLLARGLSRRRELALRAALGAGRARLVRQLVTESLVLALGGGLLGIAAAWSAVRVLATRLPEPVRVSRPYLNDLGLPGGVVLAGLLIALAIGVAAGLLPALSATKSSLVGPLGAGVRSTAPGWRARELLVGVEIALTVVLLVAAGLVGRSLAHLLAEDGGFEAEGVLTMRVALSGERYREPAAQRRFFSELLGRVTARPGVERAGAVTQLPLSGGGRNAFVVQGRPEPGPGDRPDAVLRGVAGAYLETLGIPLVEGRAFDARDVEGAERVVLVNASLARSQFGRPDAAIGQQLRFSAFPESVWRVVGVVGDVRTLRLDEPPPPTIYYSARQVPDNRMSLVVRGGVDAAAIAAEARALDPVVPVYAAGNMADQVARSPAVVARRYPLVLMALFSALALVLAAVGLYGVVAYGVSTRTRELGIRAALGAQSADALRLVFRDGAAVAATGITAGIVVALGLSRFLETLLYGVRPADPWTYLGAATIVAFVAAAATGIPAGRAARIDPLDALRAE